MENKAMSTHSSESITSINDKMHTYYSLMYTLTIAVLSFGLSSKESLILLMPFAIILPIYSYINQLRRDVCKIAAYIICFEENSVSYLWEKRVQEYDLVHNTKGIHTSLLMQHLLIVTCACCSIYKCLEQPYTPMSRIVRIMIAVLLMVLSMLFIEHNKVNYYLERDKQMKRWKTVKEFEESRYI